MDNLAGWFVLAFRDFCRFRGRARRSVYWPFQLFMAIVFLVIGLMAKQQEVTPDAYKGLRTLLGFLLFPLLVHGLALAVRRLHDIGKRGYLLLIPILLSVVRDLVVVGNLYVLGLFVLVLELGVSIYILVMLCSDSQYGPNQYGPNPKGLGN